MPQGLAPPYSERVSRVSRFLSRPFTGRGAALGLHAVGLLGKAERGQPGLAVQRYPWVCSSVAQLDLAPELPMTQCYELDLAAPRLLFARGALTGNDSAYSGCSSSTFPLHLQAPRRLLGHPEQLMSPKEDHVARVILVWQRAGGTPRGDDFCAESGRMRKYLP